MNQYRQRLTMEAVQVNGGELCPAQERLVDRLCRLESWGRRLDREAFAVADDDPAAAIDALTLGCEVGERQVQLLERLLHARDADPVDESDTEIDDEPVEAVEETAVVEGNGWKLAAAEVDGEVSAVLARDGIPVAVLAGSDGFPFVAFTDPSGNFRLSLRDTADGPRVALHGDAGQVQQVFCLEAESAEQA